MTATSSPTVSIASPSRAHVFDPCHPRATHVFDPAPALADRPTLGYTLAGSPSGNLRAGRDVACG